MIYRKLDNYVKEQLSQQLSSLHLKNTADADASDKNKPTLKMPIHLTIKLEIGQELNLVNSQRYGFIGLHTCGDLGPLILTSFANSPKAQFVVSVGCCFMKLTENG